MMLQVSIEMNCFFFFFLFAIQCFFVLLLCLIFNWFRKQFKRALTTIKIGKKEVGKKKEHYRANNGSTYLVFNCVRHFLPLYNFYIRSLKSFFSSVFHIIQLKSFKAKVQKSFEYNLVTVK